ncbi:MAG: ferrous iron transport protein [Candidatus Sumerlaeota bacterium]|nr:ferrous iron transport protein [Candidatus Sumerlaeota bacterium]
MISVLRNLLPSTAAKSNGIIPLSRLESDEQALIVEVGRDCRNCQRLCSMGLVPGSKVRMVCQGRTCLLCLGRTRLSLRAGDLDAIMVERLTA